MSKKTTTTSTQTSNSTQNNTFDPASKAAYDNLQSSITSNLNDYMKNPLNSTFFDQRNQMMNNMLSLTAQRNQSNILQNAGTFASGDTPAYLQSALQRNQRALSANQSNSFLNNLLYADQTRQSATNAAQGYRPLQTGGTSSGSMTGNSTQTVSGLGTWLPQLAGAALGGVTGALTGGLMGGKTSGSFGGGDPSALSGSISSNNSFISGLAPQTYSPSSNYWNGQ